MFKPGQSGNPKGRPKGSPNKVTKKLVLRILQIEADLAKEGKGLLDCAREKPEWFYQHFLARIIPRNLEISGDIGIEEKLRQLWQSRNAATGSTGDEKDASAS